MNVCGISPAMGQESRIFKGDDEVEIAAN